MKFLFDMNFAADWTEFLGGAGFTAVHWSDEGMPNATDREVMQWVADRGYVLVATDLDKDAVVALAGTVKGRASVILAPPGLLTPEALGGALLAAIHKAKPALEAGAIVTIDAEGVEPIVIPLPGR